MNRKKLHTIYSWITAIVLIATAAALILSCLAIYHSGDRPYSPESIARQFQKIALLVYAAMVVILAGIVLRLVFPVEKKRPKATPSPWMQLQRLRKKAGSLAGPYAQSAGKERSHRATLTLAVAAVCTALTVYPLFYLGDLSHFTVENLNGDVIRGLAVSVIPAAAGLCLCLLCGHLQDQSYLREIAIWKEAISVGAYTNEPQPTHSSLLWIRCGILLLAVVLIIVGIFNGGAKDVLLKAIAICTECIGLG